MRNLRKLPLLALIAFAAACGGGDAGGENKSGDTQAATPPATETAAPAGGSATTPPAAPAGQGTVHEVRMVTTQGGASGEFQPAEITVKQGDIIRYINDGGAAHNANFQTAQGNPAGATLPAATPLLVTPNQTADVQVTMGPGTYNYQCDPHVATGMVGKVIVQ